ncbi:unnamed protein product, partial [marine sediment metagenome]
YFANTKRRTICMPNEIEKIEKIQKQAKGLTLKFKALLEDRRLTAGQDKAALAAYEGLLFWRRTELELMSKEFSSAEEKETK